jgi:hypothetical protein
VVSTLTAVQMADKISNAGLSVPVGKVAISASNLAVNSTIAAATHTPISEQQEAMQGISGFVADAEAGMLMSMADAASLQLVAEARELAVVGGGLFASAGLYRNAGTVGYALSTTRNLELVAKEIKMLPSSREFLLNRVENTKLMSLVKYLYREGAVVGNGGTADVVRHELSTGDLYSKSGHIQKAIEVRSSIKRLIDSGQLNRQDYATAMQLRQDLHEALNVQGWDKVYPNRQAMRNN